MHVEALLTSILTFLVVAISVSNNMGVIAGPASSSRVIGSKTLALIAIGGLVIGLLSEGWKFFRKPYSSMHWPYNALLLIIGIALLLILTAGGFVTSITQVFLGVYIGYLLSEGRLSSVANVGTVFLYWLVTFASSISITYVFTASLSRCKGIVKNLYALKLTSIILVLLTAYTLGANTLGFVVAFTDAWGVPTALSAVVGIAVGTTLLGGRRGVSRLGTQFYGLRYLSSVAPYISTLTLTEIGTQFSIPLPMSISIFSGILGSALAMKVRLISRRKVLMYMLMSWIMPMAASIVTSLLVFKAVSIT